RRPPRPTLLPYTTLFRSLRRPVARAALRGRLMPRLPWRRARLVKTRDETSSARTLVFDVPGWPGHLAGQHLDIRLTAEDGYTAQDRKSTRLNSSHVKISY